MAAHVGGAAGSRIPRVADINVRHRRRGALPPPGLSAPGREINSIRPTFLVTLAGLILRLWCRGRVLPPGTTTAGSTLWRPLHRSRPGLSLTAEITDRGAGTGGPAGERIAYVRMVSGTLRVRDRLEGRGRVTGIEVFDNGVAVARPAVVAGRIATLRGLSQVRIGDAVGTARPDRRAAFTPPSLETVVEPVRPADAGAVHAALTRLAEQDPLINLRRNGTGMSLSLYGEVQKEVIQATLAAGYGVDVTFRESTTMRVERVEGVGAGRGRSRPRSGHDPFHRKEYLLAVVRRVT